MRKSALMLALTLLSSQAIAENSPYVEVKLEPFKPHREPHSYPNTNQMVSNAPKYGRQTNRAQRRAGRRGRG